MSSPGAGTSPTKSHTVVVSSAEQVPGIPHSTFQHDVGFLPIPKRLRYDPDKPIHFGTFLNIFVAICNTLVCANLYYCQPILIQLSHSFSVTYDEVSRVPTLMQAGYGIGLLTISPMGDMLRRRGLIIILVSSSTLLTIGLAVTHNFYAFEVLSFLVGFTSVTPQVFLPLAADLAPPERRGSAISFVTSGFLMGILVARVLSGVVANFVDWRYVYWTSVGVQGLVLVGSYLVLPDYPARDRELSYLSMFCSMAKFMVKEPLVVQIVLITVASVASYTNFWVTLTFLLGGPPYYYSTVLTGVFGVLGIFSVVVVPLMGQVIDRMAPWYIALAATLCFIVTQVIEAGAGGITVSAVIIASIGIDISRQTQQVALTMLIFGISDTARSRLNSLLILAIFLGQVIGTSVGTQVFVHYGWRINGLLALAWCIWQLCILLLRGPHCPRQRWIGWQGEFPTTVELGPTPLPGHAAGRTSDVEKANITQTPTSGCPGTLEVDKKT